MKVKKISVITLSYNESKHERKKFHLTNENMPTAIAMIEFKSKNIH